MDWLKKKKEEAKQAASQAAAKIQNKRSTFKGEGNVLGGGNGSGSSSSDSNSAARPTSAPSAMSAAPSSTSSSSRAFKVPGFGKTAREPPPLSEDEKRQRREAQLKALDGRTNAWDKRVATARKARLQQEAEREAAFGDLPSSTATSAATTPESTAIPGPAPRVLSADEMRAFELERAQIHVGFNPYAAVISSSSEASSVMQAIGGPASDSNGGGGVYVLLRQEPARAIAAAETIIKMLRNVLKSPHDDKFRKIRVANAAIQSKVVAVSGAVDLLTEAGFAPIDVDGEQFLVLAADAFDAARVQAVLDRTEVALIQLQVDSAAI